MGIRQSLPLTNFEIKTINLESSENSVLNKLIEAKMALFTDYVTLLVQPKN